MSKKRKELGPQAQLLFSSVEATGGPDVISKAFGLVPESARVEVGESLGRALGSVGRVLNELGDGVRRGMEQAFVGPPPVAAKTDPEVRKEVGRQKRDHALEVVERGAPDGWMEAAVALIERTARLKARFTSDDVWDAGLEAPREPRALGAAFTKAVKLRLIERTGEFTTTRRSSRHAAPIAIWRSLVCERDL